MTDRVTSYLRVSRDKRGRYASVDQQETGIREAVADRELGDIVTVFCDNSLSASEYATKDRPDYLALLDHIAAGQTDLVCVWEASRISRIMSVYVDFRDVCRKHSVKVFVADSDRLYDFSRPTDRRAFLDEGGDSEQESGKSSRRILRDVGARAADGKPHGKLLYGYTREYDPKTGDLVRQVIREDQAVVVREAARRVAAGEAPNSVAEDFNARGIQPPRGRVVGWDLTQVRRMLTNRAYIARRMRNGEDVAAAQWPPILEESVYYACESRLKDPSRRTQRDTAVVHLLSGIAVCSVCNALVRVAKNRGYLTYTCYGRKSDGPRFHVGRREPRVDELVEAVLFERLSAPDAEEWLAAGTGEDPNLKAALDEAGVLRERLEAFYREAEDGDLSATGLARMERKLAPQITEAEARIKRVRLPGAVRDLVHPSAELVEAAWRPMDLTVKREVIRSLMTVEILPVGRGRRNIPARESLRITFRGED